MITEFAARLDKAALNAEAQQGKSSDISLADAYAVQEALIGRRLDRGERLTGLKLGFTSTAKMRQMNISDQIHGRLTDAMEVADGGTLDISNLIHPRIEPEVAFLIGVHGVAEAVAPAMEIIDSRYTAFGFTLPEVVADNASSSHYVIGAWKSVRDLDNLGVVLEIDGRVRETGSTAAILGDPMRALASALRLAADSDTPLKPGDIVLAGAATAAVPLLAGSHVRNTVAGLGVVEVTAQ